MFKQAKYSLLLHNPMSERQSQIIHLWSEQSAFNPVQRFQLNLNVFFFNCLVTDASQGLELWPQIIQKLKFIRRVAEWQLIQWLAFAPLSLVAILVGLVRWVVYVVPIDNVQSLWDWGVNKRCFGYFVRNTQKHI